MKFFKSKKQTSIISQFKKQTNFIFLWVIFFLTVFPVLNYAERAVKIKEMIIRTPSLEPLYWAGPGTYYDHVDEVVQNATNLKIEILSVLVRTVDDDYDRGAIMYASSQPNTHSYDYNGYSWTTDTKLQYLINKAHASGLKVYAWFPIFNDADLWDAYPEYRTQPVNNDELPIGKFCSPVNTNVRRHELNIINEFMNTKGFGFDGLRLDYLRYQNDNQDQSTFASNEYWNLYGKNIKQVIASAPSSDYDDYLRWRALKLSTFASQVKSLIYPKRLGGYLMPHSGVDPQGYFYETWSGVDYTLFEAIGMDVIPMLYWNPSTGFTVSGYTAWQWVEGNMVNARNFVEPGSVYYPCFSLDDTESEWQTAIDLMKKHNLTDIVTFDWGGGGYMSSLFGKMRNILDTANGNASYGHIVYPNNKSVISNIYPFEFHCFDVPDNNFTISTCAYRIDSGNFTNFPSAVETNYGTSGIVYKEFINPANLATGDHIMVLKTRNNNNTVSTDYIHFTTKNLNYPQIQIVNPTFNQTLSGVTKVTASVTLQSNRTISFAKYYIDDVAYSNNMTSFGSSPDFTIWSNWDTSAFPDGYHSIKIVVEDNSNYRSTSSSVQVFLDNVTESTYYVRPAGNGGNNGNLGTSWAQAWETIQYAVDNTGPGCVIWVESAWYSENVSVTSGGTNGEYKSLLASGGQVHIDGGEADVPITIDTIKYFKMKGFYLISGNNIGAYVYHSTNIKLLDCEFSDNNSGTTGADDGYAITLLNSKFVTVSNCNIYSIGWESAASNTPMWGINIDTSISNYIIDNYIHNNTADGINEVNSYGNIFKGNLITENVWFGYTSVNSKNNTLFSNQFFLGDYAGIKINNCTNFDIEQNIISNNNWIGTQYYGGIYANQSKNIKISGNRFADNYGSCIASEDSFYLTIVSNNIYASPWGGNFSACDISFSTNVVVNDNYIKTSSASGLALGNSFSNIILRNTFQSNGEYGLVISDSKNNEINQNKFYYNGWDGFYCDNAKNMNFNINTFIGNGSLIGEFINCTNFHILDNDAPTNYGGLWIEGGGGQNIIGRNTIKKSIGYYGIHILNSTATNTIERNIIVSNSVNGIQIDGSQNAIIEQNDIKHNGSLNNHAGIYLNTSRNNWIDNNNIVSNIEFGVYLNASSNNVVINNTIKDAQTVAGDNMGIRIAGSASSNFISQNYIKGNTIGITVNSSIYNLIEKNLIRNSDYGIRLVNADGTKIYNTDIFKSATDGIYIDNASIAPLPEIKNVITSSNGTGINNQSGQSLSINYCVYNDTLNNITLGIGNTNAAPRFKDTSLLSNDFHLKFNSPALASGEPNLVAGTIGNYTVTVVPEYAMPGAYTKHKILFTTLYANSGIPSDARIDITYPTGKGFGFVYATNCTTSSFWGGGSPTFTVTPYGNKLEVQRTSGNVSTSGMVEDLIISTIINPTNMSTNNKVLVEIYDNDNNLIYKEWSNDFIIGPSYPFQVTATRPQNYSTGFAFSLSNIFVSFNNDVDTNTVFFNDLQLINSTNKMSYPFSVVKVISNYIEFDTPDMIPNEFYTAVLDSSNIRDTYAQKLRGDYTWYFTTGPHNMTMHHYDSLNLDGDLSDWEQTNIISYTGNGNILLGQDTVDTGVYATTNLNVTWDSNYIYFSIVKNNDGTSEIDWYDYFALDTTRNNWGATNFSDSYTAISFTNNWRFPEFVVRFSHDGSNAGVRRYWWNVVVYKWDGNNWVTGPTVNWQGTGANESRILEFSISVSDLTNKFHSDIIPNRISILHWVDDNVAGANLQDYCPEAGPKWVTFDIDNDGDDIADGSSQPFTALDVVKSISNVTLAGVSSKAIPGALITYILSYSNKTMTDADYTIIYDRLPAPVVYFTNSLASGTTGWVFECSTNTTPDQNWTSGDYTPTVPNKSLVKWLRWRKIAVPSTEEGKIYVKVIIK